MKRSKFSLSHAKLLTCNQGQLIPVTWFETLPGDSIQHATSCLVRTAPLLAPMMARVEIKVHHWFVPLRLIWDGFEDFITGGPDGDDATIPPYRALGGGGYSVGQLPDYMGIPTGVSGFNFSVLPFRAYNLIWNEWYRDQDLETELAMSKASGLDAATTPIGNPKNVAWEKDYFTSARPWAQKGPSVTIPLGTTAPVIPDGTSVPTFTNQIDGGAAKNLQMLNASNHAIFSGANSTTLAGAQWADPGLVADLSSAVAADINDLREAFALQRYAEARARYGSRYTEYLRYLGVRSSDARLQRPEYLGGGRQSLQVSEVLQTGVTTDGDDSEGVGNLKGHGIGAMRSNRYRRFFEEHGIVISLLSVKPRTVYMEGLHRSYSRTTKEDYYQKELQHIGQQEILNQEILANATDPTGTWGYQDRYDEYRRMESSVAGEFRTTLDYWHMARDFAGVRPTLNASFVSSNPTDRVYASGSTQHELQIMCSHSIQARRMLAKNGTSFIY